jgi:hypothetical protein
VLHQRHDEQGASLAKAHFTRLVTTLAKVGGSVTDAPEEVWARLLGESLGCAAFGWNAGMAPNARRFPADGPSFHTGLPRFISEDVMSLLEDPANVAR